MDFIKDRKTRGIVHVVIWVVCAIIALVALIAIVKSSSCNYQIIDLKYGYDYAIISLPNGSVVEGNVDSWRDYEDGDQLQITIGGVTYLVHSSDAVLVDTSR